MPKIVNTALKAKAWTFEAKATGPEAKAKAKAIKFGLEAPRGQGLASRTTSLVFTPSQFTLWKGCSYKFQILCTNAVRITACG